jgi:hypothetical protein
MDPRIIERNLPELYRMSLSEKGILVTISVTLYDYLITQFGGNFSSLTTHKEGNKINLEVTLPYINYPNYIHGKLDRKKLDEVVTTFDELSNLFDMILQSKKIPIDMFLSNEPQLIFIESLFYDGNQHRHINLGLSPRATEIIHMMNVDSMSHKVREKLAKCGGIVFGKHLKLIESRKPEYDRRINLFARSGGVMSGIAIEISSQGLHFVVPGATRPSLSTQQFGQVNRNILQSHDVDTSLNQITMLMLVIAFWNEALLPVHKSTKDK